MTFDVLSQVLHTKTGARDVRRVTESLRRLVGFEGEPCARMPEDAHAPQLFAKTKNMLTRTGRSDRSAPYLTNGQAHLGPKQWQVHAASATGVIDSNLTSTATSGSLAPRL